MNILVACEESQATTKELRARGHRAFSCDLQECSGGHPEWHINGDCLPIINGNCEFITSDGKKHRIDGKWDLLIAHPPCTYLTNCGNRWFNEERYGDKAIKRKVDRIEAAAFFMQFVNADCDRIAIENPVGVMSSWYKKPTQVVHPYEFGDPYRKPTCWWLKGLNPLVPTNIVTPVEQIVYSSGKKAEAWFSNASSKTKGERSRIRSKTFKGMSCAMAEQWTA